MEDMRLIIRISREAYEIMKYNNTVNNPVCPLSQETMVRKIAEGVPEPKNPIFKYAKEGKWVWKPNGYDFAYGKVGNWCCSECKRVVIENAPIKNVPKVIEYVFCPYCGAEMSDLDFSHASGKEHKWKN